MNENLKKQLFQAAPILYKIAGKSPEWKIDASDDLFPFLQELSLEIEKFNRRYRKRAVMVMKIAMIGGELVFWLHRQIPALEKRIITTRRKIRTYRRELREALLDRAKHMGTTALFSSKLIPDWKRIMPDDLATLRLILQAAEKFAVSRGDWESLAGWYKRYLRNDDDAMLCMHNASRSE